MPFHAQYNGANKLVMWTRRKFSGLPLNTTVTTGSSYGSWEEQVFAEDSAGRLGGCIWPPRSYSCSFCRREFRSAQALGGHMNVHRRDRARLKQSPNATSENYDNHDHHHLDLCKPLGAQHIPQLRPAVYNPNPNSNKTLGVAASALSLSRVSAVVSQEICDDHIRGEIQDCGKESLLSTPKPLIDSIDVGEKTVPELKLGRENLRARDVGCQRQREGDQDDENVPSTKRRRANSILPLFGRSASANQDLHQSEVLKPGPSPVEDLDLELRLGHRPKIQ